MQNAFATIFTAVIDYKEVNELNHSSVNTLRIGIISLICFTTKRFFVFLPSCTFTLRYMEDPCDGISGNITRFAASARLHASSKDQVLTADAL